MLPWWLSGVPLQSTAACSGVASQPLLTVLRVLAVDLGASSARVAAVDIDSTPPSLEVVHRCVHRPVRGADRRLRWDWDRLMSEVVRGLELGCEAGPVASIGVDTWGVDYGLLDRVGVLVAPPLSYRDERTTGWRGVAERLGGASALYARTGIQLMAINTVFQLAAHDRVELDAADRLVMLPELVVHALTGQALGERTSAATTALVDLGSGEWCTDLVEAIGLDPRLLPQITPAPAPAGHWRGIPVHLVGGHDTASAVVALPGRPSLGCAFISSGTWLVVGAERSRPDTSRAAQGANFSNEAGALGGVRFVKNVVGFWLLEQCCRGWGDPPVDDLVAAAAREPKGGPVIDVADSRFLTPADMAAEIRAAAGLPASAGPARLTRCILDSLTAATARVVEELNAFLERPVDELHVLGGGSRNHLFNQLLEEQCQLPVLPGPVEATALGNALVQGIALGRFEDLARGRLALVSEE